ncbi:MAG: hypothetical protein WC139_00040 [Candidatus Kapaibacterium sp.]
MISELTFIREYSSFWEKIFPGADFYIRGINSVLSKKYIDKLSISEDDTNRRALVNNVAFCLFDLLIKKSIKLDKLDTVNFESKKMIRLIELERYKLSNSRFGDILTSEISVSEKPVIIELSKRLFNYYSKKPHIIISPRFKGVGILNSVEGDVAYDNTLSEVKAGGKNFKIQDLRQLYIYLALNYISTKKIDFTRIELFNPRTGMLWSEEIENVSSNLSGTSTAEILNDIIFYISEEFKSL